MSTGQATLEAAHPPADFVDIASPEDAQIINAEMDPPVDERVSKIARLNEQVDQQHEILTAAENEARRLGRHKRPSIGPMQQLDAADVYNQNIDKLIQAQRDIENRARVKMLDLQAQIADMDWGMTLDRGHKAASFWTGSETGSIKAVERVESTLKSEARRLRAAINETESRQKKAAQEVKNTEMLVADLERRLAREVAEDDKLHPERPRNTRLDIREVKQRLDLDLVELAGFQDRLADLQTKSARVETKLGDCEFCRVKIRLRYLWEQYAKCAADMGPVLMEIRELFSDSTRPSRYVEEMEALVKFPFGYHLFRVVEALPKVWFSPDEPPGRESSWEHQENFYYSHDGRIRKKEDM